MIAADARSQVAELWDAEIARWLDGDRVVSTELKPWFDSYQGSGAGAPNLDAFPEPYVGSLTGPHKAVFLALNPGPVYPSFQYEDGIYANELRRTSYSAWAARWCYLDENEEPFIKGGVNFHRKRLKFLQRWYQDPELRPDAMLALELYPWHSEKLTARFVFSAEALSMIQRYVLEPIIASPASIVFGFGKPWLDLLPKLGLPIFASIGSASLADRVDMVMEFSCKRLIHVARLGEKLIIAMQTFGGFPAPPNPADTELLRTRLSDEGWWSGT